MSGGTGAGPVPWGRTPEVVPGPLGAALDGITLSRWPYPDSPALQAADATDRLLLDTAQAWWDSGHGKRPVPGVPAAVVLEDRHGALTLPLLRAGHPVRLAQDALAQERSLDRNLQHEVAHNMAHNMAHGPEQDPEGLRGLLTRHPVDPVAGSQAASESALLGGAHTVLLQLPRSLDALEQWAHAVAAHAAEDVVFLAGGRDKHMTRRQNDVLERYFTSVVPGRGRSKSRVLTARGPRRGLPAPFPRTEEHVLPGVGPVTLAAYGATFGGTRVDPGTALLLEHLGPGLAQSTTGTVAAGLRAVDVGCGNGTIGVFLALAGGRGARAGAVEVLATDQSADACASTRESARLNGVADVIEVRRDDALATLPDASEGLLVINPPFHAGNTVDPRVALRLITESARVLRPGGELWCVWNSHLRYRSELERRVGPTRQVARNSGFTVTVSTRR